MVNLGTYMQVRLCKLKRMWKGTSKGCVGNFQREEKEREIDATIVISTIQQIFKNNNHYTYEYIKWDSTN